MCVKIGVMPIIRILDDTILADTGQTWHFLYFKSIAVDAKVGRKTLRN